MNCTKSKTNCKKCVDLLVDYLEGALPREQERELDEHFMGCPPCLDFLDQYRASTKLAREAIETEMPEALAAKLGEFLGKSCK
ncbi:MAG TPA: anti-sigma factor [Vulgatibacter sp.]|nr:anti-sigma factor [Vulgatibacter sp.]